MSTLTKEDIDRSVAGRTVPTEFLATLDEHGERTALRWRNEDESWGSVTFAEMAELTARAVTGLRELGVGHGDRVVLMMRNIPDFHWLDVAINFLGATAVSVYNSSSAEQIAYLVGHCGAKVAIVEDDSFLQRFTPVRDQLPDLATVVVLDPSADPVDGVVGPGVLADSEPADLRAEVSNASPEDLATVIYTSGTTGSPKGVMISHYNIVWTLESLLASFGWARSDMVGKRVVSYLPMAHIAERVVSHYNLIGAGIEVSTCPETSQLTAYLGQVKPNIVFGVPRVWEKVYGGLNALVAGDPENAKKFHAAVDEAIPLRHAVTWDEATPEQVARLEELDAENFALLRALLGLDEVEIAVSGAAPIPAALIEWFRAIGIPMSEVYGMSENTGPMSFEMEKVKPGLVGRALPGTELEIFPDGEVCCRGGHVFVGYLNEPEKTAEALDEDGWLHSGDIGEIDEDGYLRIIDRKKELIITAGGKNISPANLEASLKTHPLIGQAAVIGDQRPFVSALIVIDGEVAPGWAAANDIPFTTLEEFVQLQEVIDAINEGVDEAMAQFNQAERVKKIHILTEEWMPDSELLTPTSKLKRRGIHARYEKEIEQLYQG